MILENSKIEIITPMGLLEIRDIPAINTKLTYVGSWKVKTCISVPIDSLVCPMWLSSCRVLSYGSYTRIREFLQRGLKHNYAIAGTIIDQHKREFAFKGSATSIGFSIDRPALSFCLIIEKWGTVNA